MKRILLSVLACGMFASAFAQPEISKKNNGKISEKWVITPVPTMKGVLGRLDINFPSDVERDILIYQPADNKFLTSVSRNDKIYTIAPGQYRFTLTNVPVENVPIQKGHETRLKAGFLDIVSEGDWHLYDETKEKAYTSGNKPKKLPLPVGRYQIKLGGQFYPVIIKDGETVEDSSPVEVNDETPVEIKEKTPGQQNLGIIETDKWTLTPGVGFAGKGYLNMELPLVASNSISFGINNEQGTLPSVYYTCGPAYQSSCPIKYALGEGKYRISLIWNEPNPNNDLVLIKDVPILADYETRLKVGTLDVIWPRHWSLYDETKQTAYAHRSGKMEGIVLPVGVYHIRVQFDNSQHYYRVEIKEGAKAGLNPFLMGKSEAKGPKWIIKPIVSKAKTSLDSGRLNVDFSSPQWKIKIYNPADDQLIKELDIHDHVNSFNLSPGKYQITLSGVPLKNVPIETGNETRLKVGILYAQPGAQSFEVFDAEKQVSYFIISGYDKIILPVGSYQLMRNGTFYPFIINDGETVEF